MNGWIGVDLDGTLATYDKWRGIEHIGEPVLVMLDRVKNWLAKGYDVRIFTARVSREGAERVATVAAIDAWCLKHLGRTLPVTCVKDFAMVELWDDRCVTVEANTGRILTR